jgi:hypothetical protein
MDTIKLPLFVYHVYFMEKGGKGVLREVCANLERARTYCEERNAFDSTQSKRKRRLVFTGKRIEYEDCDMPDSYYIVEKIEVLQ